MTDATKILLVDDQDRNLDALEAILDGMDYELVRARSANEALLHLLKIDFAAIVCDIKMPGIGGIELAQIIKQRKRTQHIPILFLTAHTPEQDEMLRGYGVGAVDYLSKPINPQILRLKIGVFVELFRKTRALAEANQALAEEVQQRVDAQEALRIARDDLELRVQERTAELLAANRAIKESEDRLLIAMQGASMGVFSHDLRSGRILWSAAMENTFGVPPGGFEGDVSAFVRRIHPDDRRAVLREIQRAAEVPEDFSIEFRFLRDDQPHATAEFWMSMVGRFVLDEQGRAIHSVGVSTDVTARRLAADEMLALKNAAESANNAKDHFLAVLSHELRTPLTPVLATVQDLLRWDGLAPQVRESLDIVHRNVELEARLIDDLLDLTRISRGKLDLQRSVVDVHQIIEHAVRTCDADFRSKQVSLKVDLQATSFFVHGDRARLLQVFWNLLKNAAKFTPTGQSVELRTRNGVNGKLCIETRDTGVGIDPVRLGSIFNAFDQGSAEITRQYGGLGLGLSIGKALVDLHGGVISARSDGVGHGATFTVELPTVAAAPADVQPAAIKPASEADTQSAAPAGKVSLLLVEDHPDTSRVMSRLLRACGYEVTTADGVTSALRVVDAAHCTFNIIVSDIGLPDGSGLDLMRQLRVRCPGVPAIALSGFGMEEDRRKSEEAGFIAHMTKPVDFTKLRHAIERSLLHPAMSESVD